MLATLEQLVGVRSQLAEEVKLYLKVLSQRAAELPKYFPTHLRASGPVTSRFDHIRQTAQVVERAADTTPWGVKEQKLQPGPELDIDNLLFYPGRPLYEIKARTDQQASGHALWAASRMPLQSTIPWNSLAGEHFTRAIILGNPGFGKTWLLSYEARQLSQRALRALQERTVGLDEIILPIFARLSEVNQDDDPIEATLVSLISRGRSDTFRRFVQTKLEAGRCAVLLDAWDEVPVEIPSSGQPIAYHPHCRQRLGQRLEAFVYTYPNVRLLLTSRIVGYTIAPIPAQELELVGFQAWQIESFVRVWFDDNTETAKQFLATLERHMQVRGLAQIPLMLAFMCRAYQEKQLAFPTRRVDLYDRCVRGMLHDWKEEKDQQEISSSYVSAMIELLEAVGTALFNGRDDQFSEQRLHAVVTACLHNLPHTNPLRTSEAAPLIAQLKRDGVLIKGGDHREAPLLFFHRSFYEYLAASGLARQAMDKGWHTIDTRVDKRAWLPAWQEVIVLLAGRIGDPTPLLKLLANKKTDDFFRHRLALAAHCLTELSIDQRHFWS